MQAFPALLRVAATVVAAAMALFLGRAAADEVSLEEIVRKCLLLENFWALKSPQDATIAFPNDGSAVCFGYLLAFRDLQGAIVGTDCIPAQSCRRTQQFCIPEKTSDMQILSAFLAYAGTHIGQWHEPAAFHYLNAMQEAFPCKDDRK
jgi:Rap1a immunity proteins